MNPKKWIDLHYGGSQHLFAANLPSTQPTVSRWITGKQMPSPPMMARIRAMTNGGVTPNDWLDNWLERRGLRKRMRRTDMFQWRQKTVKRTID